jgi:hypothetical protein
MAGKRAEPIIPTVELLRLCLDRETEEFLCQVEHDSEWVIHNSYDDGTRQAEVFEVTDETPPDRAVVLHRRSDGKEFLVRWTIDVVER